MPDVPHPNPPASTHVGATPLLLVAASGLAREVLALLRTPRPATSQVQRYEVIGALDDSPALAGRDIDGVPVLGGLDAVQSYPDAAVLACAGQGRVRESMVARLAVLGVSVDRYASVVHPGVEVPPACTLGPGCIVLAGVVLTAAVTVGRHVVLMPHVTLTHDDTVDDFATLCAGVTLGGGVTVGRAAYLGMNASVREHVHVGVGATLGMGAVLLNDLPARQIWVGNPARPLVAPPSDEREIAPPAAAPRLSSARRVAKGMGGAS